MNNKLLFLMFNFAIIHSSEPSLAKCVEIEVKKDLEEIHAVNGFVDKLPEWFTRPMGNIKLYRFAHDEIKGTIDSVIAFHTFPLCIDRFKDKFLHKYTYKGFTTFSTPAILRFFDHTLQRDVYKTLAFEISIDKKNKVLVHRAATTESKNSESNLSKNEMYGDFYYVNGLLLNAIHQSAEGDPINYQHDLSQLYYNSSKYLRDFKATHPSLGYRGACFKTDDPEYIAAISNFSSVIFQIKP